MEPELAEKENTPLTLVMVPFIVPFSTTEAPITGSPLEAEVIVPDTLIVWDIA